MNISDEEKKAILKLARKSIAELFAKAKDENSISFDEHPIMKTKSGAFVTLTIDGQLRGCIGYIISSDPLHETIKNAAIQAAIGDPRFPNLTEPEFDKIMIEVSILSEPFPMNTYDDIEIGKHGIILEEPSRALLLPQVPIEHNMNRDQFLSALCQKAGLYSDYWRETELKMSLFTATVFSEKEFKGEL